MFKHWIEGGPFFMSLVYIMWIIVIVFVVKSVINYFSPKATEKFLLRQSSWILFFGSFAFLTGIFAQMVGFYEAMHAIQQGGDISPAMIAGGFQVSLLAPMYGFFLLLLSALYWFLYRKIVQKKFAKMQ
ncbi:MotA/TolQ/ExbB proton channel family protein [Salinivirga cyanobacteriivorans]